MIEITLELARVGLLRAAKQLEKKGDSRSKKLAKVPRAADAGIGSYLDDE